MQQWSLIILCAFFSTVLAHNPFSQKDITLLQEKIYTNILTSGAVIASPSTNHPDYYYHWVRDAALTMRYIEMQYEKNNQFKNALALQKYVNWVTNAQNAVGDNDFGEPKFYVDGRVYTKPWGRPQNDGPALRAITLIRFANFLLKQGNINYVRQKLYNNTLNPQTMGIVKRDLEYIAHHFNDDNFDLWEESYGQHFFTMMVQKRALADGANLAKRLNDIGASHFYQRATNAIEKKLLTFVDKKNQTIKASLTPHKGPQKLQELDTAILIACLINHEKEGPFALNSVYVKNTVDDLFHYFKDAFAINKDKQKAVLIGRYPGDTYDGYETQSQGNPWFITTATIADYYFSLAKDEKDKVIQQALIKKGDAYLNLIKDYAPNNSLSEQINRQNGAQQGAIDLTWSYVALLSAIEKRV